MGHTLPASARLYVGDYASYNNGFLHGQWIDLDGKSTEEIWSDIDTVLAENTEHLGQLCEEPMFQDYEGFPEPFYHESCIDFESLAAYLDLDEDDRERVCAYLEHDNDLQAALAHHEDVIIWNSFGDCIDELPLWSEIPGHYHYLIDQELLERDLRISGNFTDLEDGRVAEILF